MSHIAIDFGTARTKIARIDKGTKKPQIINLGREIPWAIPSLFYISKEGQILIGDDAQDAYKANPVGIVRGLKMELHKANRIRRNGHKFERVQLAAELFKWIRQECNRQVFHHEPVTTCTITVPPGFSIFEVDCLKSASLNGGFEAVDIIDEPISAARSWLAFSSAPNDFITVFDIGGGTSDLALVKREGNRFSIFPDIPPEGIPRGGNDIDNFILDHLELDDIPDKFLPGLLVRLRQIKEQVTNLKNDAKLNIAGQSFPITYEIVDDCCRLFIDSIINHVVRFGEKIKNVVGVDLNEIPMVLVGGGRYIIGIQEAISNIWPNVYLWEESERATVLGALIEGNVELNTANKTNSTSFEKYRKFINSITPPSEKSDIEFKKNFLKKIETLKAFRDSLINIDDSICEKIEINCWGKTAEHLKTMVKLRIKDNQNMNQAISVFNKAVSKWNKGGENYLQKVIEFSEIALVIYPQYYPPIYLIALSLAESHHYKEAIEKIEKFLESGVTPSKSVLFKLGSLRLKMDKADLSKLAFEDFSLAIKAEISEELSTIDSNTDPDNNILLLYRAYAKFHSNDKQIKIVYTQCIDALDQVIKSVEGGGNKEVDYSLSPALLLAIKCHILHFWMGSFNLENFKKIFNNRFQFELASKNLESQFDDLKVWKKWFKEPYSKDTFEDQLKIKLLSDLNNYFKDNNRQQIQKYIEITFKENGIDPLKSSTGELLIEKDATLFLIAANSFTKLCAIDLADKYFCKVWETNPSLDLSEIRPFQYLPALMKTKVSLEPQLSIKTDIGFFKNTFIITNNSLYTLNNVNIVHRIIKKDGSELELHYLIKKILSNETKDMKKALPQNLEKTDNIYIKDHSCDEMAFLKKLRGTLL